MDVIALLVALLTFVVSKEVAILVGPYAAIMVSASAGAALSLSAIEGEMDAWWRPLQYLFVRILVAIVLTGALAELAHFWIPEIRPRMVLVPLAFGIGWIRDYGAVMRWIGNALRKILPKWLADIGRKNG